MYHAVFCMVRACIPRRYEYLLGFLIRLIHKPFASVYTVLCI